MKFTTPAKAVSFASLSVLIYGLSSSLPVYAYFKESPIEATSNRVNRQSELPNDRKIRDRYLLSKELETEIKEHFNEGNKNFELGNYQLAASNYGNAIRILKILRDSNYSGERGSAIVTNLINCYENRSITYMKIYSARSDSYYKRQAIEDLGEVVKIYNGYGDRVNAFETIQKIRSIGGSEAANKYTF
ncbi:hypothetical protein [Chamaesiphon sp. OTE_20_metabat_361]|uniref:hypothetical protein n=1 Tax=Chamaesiphon sp. OTE_20_metabat_361 TaxID=2964689 RepID=UPI002869F26C|nr:hypothetical protein [Chamaesiphon sp. OTE_20_metabat_361]